MYLNGWICFVFVGVINAVQGPCTSALTLVPEKQIATLIRKDQNVKKCFNFGLIMPLKRSSVIKEEMFHKNRLYQIANPPKCHVKLKNKMSFRIAVYFVRNISFFVNQWLQCIFPGD